MVLNLIQLASILLNITIRFAIDNEINAHNMFFDTLISVGIIGVLLLLAYFIIPLVLWIKRKQFDMLYFSFLIMIGFNALFESIFEVQLGIIFFCFFNSLLFTMSFRPTEGSGEITGNGIIRNNSKGGNFSTTALPSLEMTD